MSRTVRVIACCWLFSGCGRSEGIVGKWQTAGPAPMVWEFSGSGAVTQGSVHGRYSFGDNDRIKIETPFATGVYRVQLASDHLTLVDASGSKIDFNRMKDSAR